MHQLMHPSLTVSIPEDENTVQEDPSKGVDLSRREGPQQRKDRGPRYAPNPLYPQKREEQRSGNGKGRPESRQLNNISQEDKVTILEDPSKEEDPLV